VGSLSSGCDVGVLHWNLGIRWEFSNVNCCLLTGKKFVPPAMQWGQCQSLLSFYYPITKLWKIAVTGWTHLFQRYQYIHCLIRTKLNVSWCSWDTVLILQRKIENLLAALQWTLEQMVW
jgi:hypothetical protein